MNCRFEAGARFFLMSKFCAALTLISFSAQAANEFNPGKYFCFVEQMAGIQLQSGGEIFSGKIKPADEKFFIKIYPAIHPEKVCDGPADLSSYADWWLCRAKWEVQIGERRLRSDGIGLSFVGTRPIGGHFWLKSDGSYDYYLPDLASYYVSVGKCTAISEE